MPASATLNVWALLTRDGSEFDIQLYKDPPAGSFSKPHVVFMAEVTIPANTLAMLAEPLALNLDPI